MHIIFTILVFALLTILIMFALQLIRLSAYIHSDTNTTYPFERVLMAVLQSAVAHRSVLHISTGKALKVLKQSRYNGS